MEQDNLLTEYQEMLNEVVGSISLLNSEYVWFKGEKVEDFRKAQGNLERLKQMIENLIVKENKRIGFKI